jgi:hypothetical protein
MHVDAWDRAETNDNYCRYVRIEKRGEPSAYEISLLVQILFGQLSRFDEWRQTITRDAGPDGGHDLTGLGVEAFVAGSKQLEGSSAHLIAQKDDAFLNVFIVAGPGQDADAIARQVAEAFAAA